MKYLLQFFLLFICIFFAATAFAQRAGSLDTTFNHTGIVYNTFAGDTNNNAEASAIQNDGKIVVCGGTLKNGIIQGVIARYTTDGSLDTSFNKNGYTITAIDSPGGGFLISVAIESNGKILALGTNENSEDSIYLLRCNTDGHLDTTFGKKGIDLLPINGSGESIALQTDGKIIVGITSGVSPDSFEVARLDTNGNLDNTFASGGVIIVGVGSTATSQSDLSDVAIQADGKIVAVGYYFPDSTIISRFALIRLDTDGYLDSTFADNGIDTVNYFTYKDANAYSVVIQPDGKIVIAGTTDTGIYSNTVVFAIARYNSNGSFDTTFANKGIANTSILGVGTSLVLQPDGKIVAIGLEYSDDGVSDFALVRLSINGTPDTSFGNGGEVFTSIVPESEDNCWSIAIQSDGKIVVAGYAGFNFPNHSYVALARYLDTSITTGILNFTTTPTSVLVYPNPVHNTETLDYTLTNTETLTINLYDVTGRVIRNYMMNETVLTGDHKQQLSFENLAAGSYILTISNEEGKTESVKVIKQ